MANIMDLRPIETAPRTGFWVILFSGRSGRSVYAAAYWNGYKWNAGRRDFDEHIQDATHWAPLMPYTMEQDRQ